MRALNNVRLDRAARKRRRHLLWMIGATSHTQMAWIYELNHIRQFGRADWVNPNPIRVRPAGESLTPPPHAR